VPKGQYEKFDGLDLEDGMEKQIEAWVQKFPVTAERGLKNYFGQFSASADLTRFGGDLAVGTIEDYFLREVIDQVNVDDKEVRISNRGVWESMPKHVIAKKDEDNDYPEESLPERLVRLGVKHNVRIAQHRKFSMVFGEYLDAGVEGQDPTEGTSTNGSSRPSLQEATSTSSPSENS
jgi:hypothetical protein